MISAELQEDDQGLEHLSCEKVGGTGDVQPRKKMTSRGLPHLIPRGMSVRRQTQAFCTGAWWEEEEIHDISYNMTCSDWI